MVGGLQMATGLQGTKQLLILSCESDLKEERERERERD